MRAQTFQRKLSKFEFNSSAFARSLAHTSKLQSQLCVASQRRSPSLNQLRSIAQRYSCDEQTNKERGSTGPPLQQRPSSSSPSSIASNFHCGLIQQDLPKHCAADVESTRPPAPTSHFLLHQESGDIATHRFSHQLFTRVKRPLARS